MGTIQRALSGASLKICTGTPIQLNEEPFGNALEGVICAADVLAVLLKV